MLKKLIEEIEKIKMSEKKYFNSVSEIACRLHLIDDDKLKIELIQLVSALEQKQQEAFENRQKDDT